MKILKLLACFYFLFVPIFYVEGQEQAFPVEGFNQYYNQALELSKLALYAESMEAMNTAIDIAQRNNLEKESIQASIDLAEILRKTQEFEAGLKVIQNIKESQKYPLQHVRLLDRLAALNFEGAWYTGDKRNEVIRSLLDSAIGIAKREGYEIEEALLKNQLGYLIDRAKNPEQALSYHLEAANLFLKNEDRQNYVGAMTKALDLYAHTLQDMPKSDSIISLLVSELEGKNWFTAESELFKFISNYELNFKQDTVAHYKWLARSTESAYSFNKAIGSTQMDNFRVQQETLKFQNEAANAELALERQKTRTRELTIYLSVLALVIVSVIALFYRERNLKKSVRQINNQLQVANEKYQMLIVESNHRIKNNLQMVISMLEFAGRDVDPKNTRAIKRMSTKIHTISALHKHLYVDVHNERVNLQTYFGEIIKLYSEISADSLQIDNQFDLVEIRSERIVYFGLIFNEMLSNTIEHCRAQLKQIKIKVHQDNDGYHFDYQDNSPWEDDFKEGTGSILIKQLVQRVGGVNFIFNPNLGQFKFTFHVES